MRILHVDSGKSMRGGQWQALLLMQGLRAAGVEQLLLAPTGSPLAEKAAAVVEVRPLGWRVVMAAAGEVDLVHAHDAKSHTMACLQRRKPLVVSRRVAFPVKRSPLSTWKYKRADKYIAVSRFVAGVLRAAGVPDGKITVVYDGVEPAEQARSRGWIVAPATDDPAKGSSLLREAGCDVRFSEDLKADLQYAALMAYITHAEGLGSAALMAMAAGVPVVASKVGGLIEVVQDGMTGFLVENRAEPIRAAMERILREPRLAQDMGTRARQRVKEMFSAELMVSRTLAVYREVLG